MSDDSENTREWTFRIDHILEAGDQIIKFTADYGSADEFMADEKTIRAVERCFEIIGEAAKHIPKSVRDQYTDIPWKRIIGFRNVLSHDYDKIRDMMLWLAVKNDLPELLRALRKIEKE